MSELSWSTVGALLSLIALFGGLVLSGVGALLKFAERSIERRLAGVELTLGQRVELVEVRTARLSAGLGELKEELPSTYVRREDWMAFRQEMLQQGAVLDAKLDRLRDLLEAARKETRDA